MSKKKQKSRLEKIVTKHDFSHLTKTKAAAKVVEAEEEITWEAKSPLDKQIRRDLKLGLIAIGIFVLLIIALWFFAGRTGFVYNITSKLKLF